MFEKSPIAKSSELLLVSYKVLKSGPYAIDVVLRM
jgi:hypothetical protein